MSLCFSRWVHRAIFAGLGWVILLAGLMDTVGTAQPPPTPTLTPAQKDRLKERDKLDQQAQELRTKGKLHEAIKAAEGMLAIERDVLGETSEGAIGSLELLASLQEDCEDFAAGMQARSEVVELRTKALGKDHWKTTEARMTLGVAERVSQLRAEERRRFLEAEKLSRRTVELNRQGRYREAAENERRSVALRKEVLGDRNFDYAVHLWFLANLLYHNGELIAARPAYEESLALIREAAGERYPTYIAALRQLGTLLTKLGEYVSAQRHLERALILSKEVLGQRDPAYADALDRLASLHQAQGQYAAARPLLERSVALLKGVAGENDVRYASALNNLGMLLASQGDLAAARPLLERALLT